MPVRWNPYVRDEIRPVEESEIEQLERDWGIRLPDDYRQVIRQHHGMGPEPDIFKVGRVRDVFCCLLTLGPDRQKAYSIHGAYDVLKQYIPPGIYPFGTTSGGEYLCFDYRQGSEQPRVVLVTVETAVHPVANSFREFLDSLHDE